MGVRRLQTFLEQHCPEACYEVSIEEIANQYRKKHRRDPVIVVDGSCCFRKLYGKLDWVCGGQYKEYVDVVNKFFDSFENLRIKLVLFFDGVTQECKRPVWINRRLQSMDKAHKVFDYLKEGCVIDRIDPELYVLPAGTGTVMSTLSRDRYSVKRSLRECDEEIACYAYKNNCLAILAQDSDFVVYEYGAKFYLSSENLNLSTMTTLAYDKVALAKHLNLAVSDLPVLATLMGNDFISADDLRPFHYNVVGRQRHRAYASVLVHNLAEYILSLPKGNDLLSFLGQLSYEIFRTTIRAEDLKQSILSYGKNLEDIVREVDLRCEKWDKILSLAHSHHVSMAHPSFIYNILRKLPFEMSTALEDYRSAVQPSALALRQMRQRIYGVALHEYPRNSGDEMTVEEWCMSGPESMRGAVTVTAISPPGDCPNLLDLWLNDSDVLKDAKFKLLGWITSVHLSSIKLSTFPPEIICAVCILSYLFHDTAILKDWEVKVFAAMIADVQIMNSDELSKVYVKKVSVRGVQLATLFTRAITHIILANSICGNPISSEWIRHPQLFNGKLFQKLYFNGQNIPPMPKRGNLHHYNQICDTVLS